MGTITKIRGNEPETVEEWQNFFLEFKQNEIESVIETGKQLILAKDKLKANYEKWLKIFEGKNRPFSEDMAQYRMSIARNPVLSNTVYVRYLPQAISTLYELSQMPEQLLLRLIQEGKVYPELKRSEVRTLKSDEQKRKEDAETLLDILLANCHNARELSLADCGGTTYDCSILKGNIPQELIDIVQEVIDTWTSLRNHLLSLK
jgi:hypothetical protein